MSVFPFINIMGVFYLASEIEWGLFGIEGNVILKSVFYTNFYLYKITQKFVIN